MNDSTSTPGRPAPVRTSTSTLTNAEICRANGWGPGTILEGDGQPRRKSPPYRAAVQITAVGVRLVLGIPRSAGSSSSGWVGDDRDESVIDLHGRDWEAVA